MNFEPDDSENSIVAVPDWVWTLLIVLGARVIATRCIEVFTGRIDWRLFSTKKSHVPTTMSKPCKHHLTQEYKDYWEEHRLGEACAMEADGDNWIQYFHEVEGKRGRQFGKYWTDKGEKCPDDITKYERSEKICFPRRCTCCDV